MTLRSSVAPLSPVHSPAGRPAALLAVVVVLVAAPGAMQGCATPWSEPLHGEQASYHVFNDTGVDRIEWPELLGDDRRTVLYANLHAERPGRAQASGAEWLWAERLDAQRRGRWTPHEAYDDFGKPSTSRTPARTNFDVDPGDESLGLPRAMSGSFNAVGGEHRIPAFAWVQWRRMPTPGQVRFQGELVGPIRVPVRERIPAAVIAQLRESWRYSIDIAIGAKESDPPLVWRLLKSTDRGIEVVARSEAT